MCEMINPELRYMQVQLNALKNVFNQSIFYPYCIRNSYDMLVPISGSNGFLHYVEYNPATINPENANSYFRQNPPTSSGACSGVFRDGKVLRHFDWIYDDSAQFIVKMRADPSRNVMFDSIGMAYATPILSRQTVRLLFINNEYHPYFGILPYTMVDGLNSAGIYVQSNVVPGRDFNININPGKQDCCVQMMLVRFLLDRLDSISNLRNILDQFHLYSTNKVEGYGIHLMVADSKKSCVIEFENDHYEVLTRYPIISNFRLNRGFKVQNLKEKNFSPNWETIEPHGMGVERWEVMSDFLKDPIGDFHYLSKKIRYTNAYDNIVEYPWLTEISYGDMFTTEKAFDVHVNGKDSQYYNDYLQQ